MSSRQDEKRRARAAREAVERDRARRAARGRRLQAAAGSAVLLSAVVAAVLLLAGGGTPTSTVAARAIPPQRSTDLATAVRLAGARTVSAPYAYGTGVHTDGRVAYPTNPPTNGPHAPNWVQDGSYAGRPAPPTGQVVHAQEHGRIVLQYRHGLPGAQLAQLQALYEESPAHVLLVENATAMPCDVAATAWGHGILCPRLTPQSFDALRAFRDAYRDRGPETVT